MRRVPGETAERVNNSKSLKGCFYAVIDRENMARSGVYPKWLVTEVTLSQPGSEARPGAPSALSSRVHVKLQLASS